MKTIATIEMNNMSERIHLAGNMSEHIQLTSDYSGTGIISYLNTLVLRLNRAITESRFAITLAAILSFIMNEQLSAAKSLHLLHACIAATCAFLFGGISWLVQSLLLVWLAATLWQCRKDGWK